MNISVLLVNYTLFGSVKNLILFTSISLYAGYLKLAPRVLMFQELPLLVYTVLTSQLQTTSTLVMPLLPVMMPSSCHYGTFKGEMVSPSSTAQ